MKWPPLHVNFLYIYLDKTAVSPFFRYSVSLLTVSILDHISHKSISPPKRKVAAFVEMVLPDQPVNKNTPMSVSQITPTLFLSGVDAALNKVLLSHRGITLIINASPEHICPEHQGVECLRVPISDVPHAPLTDHFENVAERIHKNPTGSTLVHCSAGRSRSPALVMAYLMRYKGVTLRQAHDWVCDCRPHIRPNAGFWRQLLDYEKKLYGKNTVKMIATPLGVLPEAIVSEGDSERCLSW